MSSPQQGKKRKAKIIDLDDGGEPEFQVAPMVDVLLVLLLFFMSTATTEVVTQTADLKLPDANAAQEKQSANQIVVNIEKINYRLKVEGAYFDRAEDISPIIKNAYSEACALNPEAKEKFRVMIRADEKTPYSRINEVMSASAVANVWNVAFGVSDKKVEEPGAAPAPATKK